MMELILLLIKEKVKIFKVGDILFFIGFVYICCDVVYKKIEVVFSNGEKLLVDF